MREQKGHLVDQEVDFAADEQLVSTTDLRGVITYANDNFAGSPVTAGPSWWGSTTTWCAILTCPRRHLPTCGQTQAGPAMARHGEEPLPGWSLLLGGCLRHPIFEQGKISGYQSVRCRADPQMKQIAARTYARLRAAEQGGGKPRISLARLRHGVAVAGLLALGWLGTVQLGGWAALYMALPLILLGLLYRHELITTPRYLQQLAGEYDSLTRLIYSGQEPSAIADFHIKLLQARIRTVLGRVDDATTPCRIWRCT